MEDDQDVCVEAISNSMTKIQGLAEDLCACQSHYLIQIYQFKCSRRLIRLSSHAYDDHTPENPCFHSYPSSIKHLKAQGQKDDLEVVCTPTLKSV